MALTQSQTLANGVKIPVIGFGVAQIPDGDDTYNSVKSALEQGYRHIDTAAYYKNEESVGRAIRECGIPREEIFLTTKLWNADQGYETTLAAFDASLKRLGLDYVDLYLIHWPGKDKFVETWKAFEHLYKEKKIRAIGVSNFQIHHLETLKKEATVMPMLDQIELHPWLTQVELREYCAKNNIVVTAWSPLAQGKVLNEPVLAEIGKKHNKSPAQVIIRWDLQSNIVTIPKSATPARIVQNSQVFDFELSAEEVAAIDALNQNKRIDYDPDTYF